ncbi:uncharacterized protein LOC132714422 [Ruditapes philippinarum]|uniref:uncharacterized protein LOC132714422 n=1 Tax=Ruditapes philippinarum TaxID=129788 RepID=UPI00295B4159|nr:uncharacterized protein LOC132714422 [Ruditapes philippinarum]
MVVSCCGDMWCGHVVSCCGDMWSHMVVSCYGDMWWSHVVDCVESRGGVMWWCHKVVTCGEVMCWWCQVLVVSHGGDKVVLIGQVDPCRAGIGPSCLNPVDLVKRGLCRLRQPIYIKVNYGYTTIPYHTTKKKSIFLKE